MTVRELVGGDVQWISRGKRIQDAARLMNATAVGSLAVGDGNDLEGIITERDILRAVADEPNPVEAVVADYMTAQPDSIGPETSVEEAADWMLATGYRHLPVVDEGTVIGVVSIKDVLWALTGSSAG